MSIDKFIDILATKEIYFTPLTSYGNTDPFEGLLPKVALDAFAGVFQKTANEVQERTTFVTQFLDEAKSRGEVIDASVLEEYDSLVAGTNNMLPFMEKAFFKIMSSVTVNCWHMNNSESEAMWRLYSDTNKGVAIQTTLSSLLESITTEKYITLSEVKYIDFNDPNLTARDCVHNGNLVPYLKRNAFAHENEVRLSISPGVSKENIDDYVPQGIRVSVDPAKLIEKIYISPYASQPYPSSVYAIAGKFDLDENIIIKSDLLTVDDSLKRIF